MKIRTGFVSNSSSSSFIIGLANVTNVQEKEYEHMKDYVGIFYSDNIACTRYGREYVMIGDRDCDVTRLDDERYKLTIESFMYSSVTCTVKDGDKVFAFYGTGPAGDEYFWDESYGEMDYDKIGLYDFENEDVESYKLCQKYGESEFGAGRDG